MYFNPRTRVGCDRAEDNVSQRKEQISIHAPAWGATKITSNTFATDTNFNPRTRVGCDKT